ncbi:hypothetical protein TVAG_028920 [Trichomonas vaginalis G3]|uniref:Uncharacterized protein n=1 Tax=Trichomonas vaginalis (strain ATCC PRA-98 / G3) TaxID=412133 RepID=A2E0D9_TRIV3|nr:cytosolic regulator pianissimo family [Trichomonas vaginalis G3]EAY13939.1 hypothetical protein TVAG_028920 [Trichomonas vaginalis G3]KAI5520866.1 cytosolic regulator pianissimo family [Trichomonas vaginalis G3]|eukprot:XP_001326162.1 hypothetical protein [Trichomonas vaginalis G3]
MISCQPALLLKSVVDSDYDDITTVNLIMAIEKLFLNEEFENIPMDFVAMQIHQLFTINSTSIKCVTLTLCMTFEQLAPESITEKYHFDYLIANLLSKPVQESSNNVDKEKIIAISYTQLLFQYRYICPDSIVRALVATFQLNRNRYHEYSAFLLCNILSYVPDIARIPEVCQIVFDYLLESGKLQVALLIAHAIEKRQRLISDPSLLYSLFSSIAGNSVVQSPSGLISLLRTWPGIIFLGLQREGLSSILMCLSNQTETVVEILKNLLCLSAPKDSVIIPFCLFILERLIPLNIVKLLDRVKSQNVSAEKLLTDLVPMIGVHLEDNFTVQKLHQRLKPPPAYVSSQPPQHPIMNVSELQLTQEPSLWDWPSIQLILTIVLPHSEIDANSAPARNFYSKLFDFFSGPFLTVSTTKNGPLSQSLLCLIQLLMMWQWGYQIIEQNTSFKKAVSTVIDEICGETPIDPSSPMWIVFKAIAALMCHIGGVAVLSKWGILPLLQKLGSTCRNISNAETILCHISLYPDPELSVAVFAKFLSLTKDDKMHKAALDELRAKQNSPGNFCQNVFNGIIMPHCKEAFAANPCSLKLNRCLALFCEVIESQEDCLKAASVDQQMHQVLKKANRRIYSMLLSQKDSLSFVNLEEEIDWWIEKGNKEYVEIYDEAISCSFNDTVDESISKYPEIRRASNKHARIPCHLFSELSKNAKARDLLISKLQKVIEKTKDDSIKERRGAVIALSQFASVKETSHISDEMKIVEHVINASNRKSYNLLGTIISCLSMFYVTSYFMDTITKYGFKLVRSGDRSATLPTNILEMIDDIEVQRDTFYPNIDVPEPFKETYNLVMQLPNQLLTKEARSALNTMIKSGNSPFLDPGFAFILNKALSQATFAADIRSNIYQILDSTPLMRVSNENVDKNDIKVANILVEKASVMQKPDFSSIEITEEEMSAYGSSSFASYEYGSLL